MRGGATILMYHAVGAPGERAGRFVVPVKRFERQMRWLVRRGYRVVPLDQLVRQLDRPGKTVALTFDDGYHDNLTLARPVLERLSLPATVFAVSGLEWNEPSAPTRERIALSPAWTLTRPSGRSPARSTISSRPWGGR